MRVDNVARANTFVSRPSDDEIIAHAKKLAADVPFTIIVKEERDAKGHFQKNKYQLLAAYKGDEFIDAFPTAEIALAAQVAWEAQNRATEKCWRMLLADSLIHTVANKHFQEYTRRLDEVVNNVDSLCIADGRKAIARM